MCQALGLYELCQRDATCVQAPRCHHTATPQCFAPTHSKKKNPASGRKTFLLLTTTNYTPPPAILVSFSRILENCYDVCGSVKVILFTLILHRCKVIKYAKRSL